MSKSVSIGYFETDGRFRLLAALNNEDGHIPDDEFEQIVTKMYVNINVSSTRKIVRLQRRDIETFVDIEADAEEDEGD